MAIPHLCPPHLHPLCRQTSSCLLLLSQGINPSKKCLLTKDGICSGIQYIELKIGHYWLLITSLESKVHLGNKLPKLHKMLWQRGQVIACLMIRTLGMPVTTVVDF